MELILRWEGGADLTSVVPAAVERTIFPKAGIPSVPPGVETMSGDGSGWNFS